MKQCARVDLVAFDKTGTLTIGRPAVERIIPATGTTERQLLELAMQVESGSTHPLALGIITRAEQDGLTSPPAHGVVNIPGRGLRITTSEGEILLGSRRFLTEENVLVPELASGSLTEVYCAHAGSYRGAILINDPTRSDAAEVIDKIKSLGMLTALLTGDRQVTAEQVSSELGIRDVVYDMSPTDKAKWLEQ